jgi:CelD/BcsL family acetyltransferase involved in cellulose biosynthesis
MPIDIVRDQAALARMAAEWNDLLAGAVSDVPFLRHEYVSTWWSSLGGGEWPEGELCLVVERGPEGRLSGIAPLFRTRASAGSSTLHLIGSREISDYLDVIVAPDEHAPFVEACLSRLETEAWDNLELDNVLEGSPTLTVMEAAARRRGWATRRSRGKPCPLVDLEGGWEGYLARLDKKQRHELRRKMRRAEEHPSKIDVQHIRATDRPETEIEDFLQLMATDPGKAAFLTGPMRQHFHELARVGFEHGWLELSLLLIDGQPAAGYLDFVYRNRLWIYNSGFEPSFLALSPGWVLLGYVIQAAAESGVEAVDFLRGEEDYKTRLGGSPRYVERLEVRRG